MEALNVVVDWWMDKKRNLFLFLSEGERRGEKLPESGKGKRREVRSENSDANLPWRLRDEMRTNRRGQTQL
jgi:hypothetical protein